MINYEKILVENYKGKAWSYIGTSYEGLTWLDESPKPTQAELDALWETTQRAINARAYIEKRKEEYPPATDYLDGVVKGDQAQIDKYIADCLAVKAKYPK
jgi:hypothetical protein